MLSNQQVTDEMIEAGLEAWNRTAGTRADMIRNAYTAMQSAQPLPSGYEELVEKLLEPSGPNQARRNLYEQLAVEAIRTLEAKLAEAEAEIETANKAAEKLAGDALELEARLAEVERERDAAQRQFAAAIAQNIMESNKHDFVQAVADLSLTLDADEANPAAYWLSMLTQLRTGAKLIVEHKP